MKLPVNAIPAVFLANTGEISISHYNVERGSLLFPGRDRIVGENAEGVTFDISGPADVIKKIAPVMFERERNWNGKGEPKVGQRVKMADGLIGVVVLVDNFLETNIRAAVLRDEIGGYLRNAMSLSVLRAVDRELTDAEKDNIAAVDKLVRAGVISRELGDEVIQNVKDGTKS